MRRATICCWEVWWFDAWCRLCVTLVGLLVISLAGNGGFLGVVYGSVVNRRLLFWEIAMLRRVNDLTRLYLPSECEA